MISYGGTVTSRTVLLPHPLAPLLRTIQPCRTALDRPQPPLAFSPSFPFYPSHCLHSRHSSLTPLPFWLSLFSFRFFSFQFLLSLEREYPLISFGRYAQSPTPPKQPPGVLTGISRGVLGLPIPQGKEALTPFPLKDREYNREGFPGMPTLWYSQKNVDSLTNRHNNFSNCRFPRFRDGTFVHPQSSSQNCTLIILVSPLRRPRTSLIDSVSTCAF